MHHVLKSNRRGNALKIQNYLNRKRQREAKLGLTEEEYDPPSYQEMMRKKRDETQPPEIPVTTATKPPVILVEGQHRSSRIKVPE